MTKTADDESFVVFHACPSHRLMPVAKSSSPCCSACGYIDLDLVPTPNTTLNDPSGKKKPYAWRIKYLGAHHALLCPFQNHVRLLLASEESSLFNASSPPREHLSRHKPPAHPSCCTSLCPIERISILREELMVAKNIASIPIRRAQLEEGKFVCPWPSRYPILFQAVDTYVDDKSLVPLVRRP